MCKFFVMDRQKRDAYFDTLISSFGEEEEEEEEERRRRRGRGGWSHQY